MSPDLAQPTAAPGSAGEVSAHAARDRFWRSIAEAQGGGDTASNVASLPSLGRRDFMKILGASLALAGAPGCSRTAPELIVPYKDGPAQQTYGKPVFFATAIPHDGYGLGVLVGTQMGRPTKIEGNPQHPSSLGATDVFRQAAVLELWDPERSQTLLSRQGVGTWNEFLGLAHSRLQPLTRGKGLRILTGMVTSPSERAQIAALLERFPQARWHQWQPVNRDQAIAGGTLAYGEPVEAWYRLDRARTVVALDGDFLDDHPAFVRYALDFSTTRKALAPAASRSRLYALECTPTLTGAASDHRLAIRASDMALAARQMAGALGVVAAPSSSVIGASFLQAMISDLQDHRGASLIVAGPRQPPAVHALVHAMNEVLGNVGNTVQLIAPAALQPVDHLTSLRELVEAMRGGDVAMLVMSGVNPVYTAPADFGFSDALAKVPFKVHHDLYRDETAALCDWHLPAVHALERWGDLASFDGTVSLQQPCIAPLYDGKSLPEVLAALAGDAAASGRDLLNAYWRDRRGAELQAFFDAALRMGVIDGSASPPRRPKLRADAMKALAVPDRTPDDVELVFAADARTGDGRLANNAWLQELPKPLSLLTWDNAALMSPALAARLLIRSEDVVELSIGNRRVAATAWIMPGMPDRSVTLALGYGRSAAGEVGNGHGANAYALRTGAAPWIAQGLAIERTGHRHRLACAQTHHSMEGRDIVRSFTQAQAVACAAEKCGTPGYRGAPTLYDSPPTGPYAWAMSVDLSSCIGCGACTIACQAENNVPVVGYDEVLNGREMHWIRVDRYYEGPIDRPRTLFQPVPCMQCEHAPCEVVCPVEASVHDAQGINVQVYNRCVGTRFCSNNCPYKVRRFNFLDYTRNVPGLTAQRNPEVTVRMRGVMEKCNYCLQRITTAKIAADRDGRRLRDGEVITACQAVCPTHAIVFGDLADPQSEVVRRKRSPLDYALLAELNTRPRTTYLARVTNPSDRIPE